MSTLIDGRSEVFEVIRYHPSLQDTGDLEAATRTITALAEPATADYSATLILPASPDPRLLIFCVVSRLNVVIDTLGAGTTLYCRVYVDAKEPAKRLFDLSWTTTGNKLAVTSAHFGTPLLSILTDGKPHTFLFFFWVSTGSAVISLVRLWLAVGSEGTAWREYVRILHCGFLKYIFLTSVLGTGSVVNVTYDIETAESGQEVGGGVYYLTLTRKGLRMTSFGTVATDIIWLRDITFWLRKG